MLLANVVDKTECAKANKSEHKSCLGPSFQFEVGLFCFCAFPALGTLAEGEGSVLFTLY